MTEAARPLPAGDLQAAASRVGDAWRHLSGAEILLTGGTGFVGRWLLEVFLEANASFDLGASLTVVSRDPDSFLASKPHLAQRTDLKLLASDVTRSELEGSADVLIHCAGPRRDRILEGPDDVVRNELCEGAATVALSVSRTRVGRVLLLSSGAVYPDTAAGARAESQWDPAAGDRDAGASGYTRGKRATEKEIWALSGDTEVVIARCFSLLGPGMGTNYAATRFIADALEGGPIEVTAPGARRSYLYAADAAWWLWTLVSSAPPGAYNVGSDQGTTMRSVADRVASAVSALGRPAPTVEETPGQVQQGVAPKDYLPDVQRARRLGLEVSTTLDDAIGSTARWMSSG